MDCFMAVSNRMVFGGLLAVVGGWKLTFWAISFFKTRSMHQIREKKKEDLFLIKSNWAHQVLSQVSLW